MNLALKYPDTATFVRVDSSGYSGNKTSLQQVDIPVIFLQNTGFTRAGFQENIDADAICYPDFTHAFIKEQKNRLEGMYILAPLFDAADNDGWYKIESVTVNRDHLINNSIDNIELRLKKTRPLPGVS
jgi:hypothetical protein